VELRDQRVVVTGGGSGIGRGLVRRFVAEGALVTVADIDADTARGTVELASGDGRAHAVACDVRDEQQVQQLVAEAEATFGPIDLFCSNAGVSLGGGPEASNDVWERTWQVNFVAHLYAVRAVLPGMLERGRGYLLHTASAAGLLTTLGDAPYSVSKHAVVAFAEWVSITYGDQGIGVSALCPQGVSTNMLKSTSDHMAGQQVLRVAGVLQPEDVAEAVVQGLADERFLILPHPEVAEYFRRKADDYDRWLRGMRRLHARLEAPGDEV
jgi:NAD(P)-dependent dehydrogenase (short-subunit alcohol dehydrogenase family)